MRLTMFHYHLYTGGITKVVSSALQALLSRSGDSCAVTLVYGHHQHAEEAIASIRDGLPAEMVPRLHGEHLPEIGYTSDMAEVPSPERIEELLLARYSGSLWWVHNYHIGKNPPFTEALLRIAAERPQQKMVLHIHDFPESGRFSNLAALNETVTCPLYPTGANVRYTVINSRDRDLLLSAGIPRSRVYLLNNPVSAEAPPSTVPARREQLRGWAAEIAPRWEEEGPIFLYPVRCIRRKNVLEAALAVKILSRPANLLVTLPGTSSREAPYSELVRLCFDDGLVPGVWGIGERLAEGGFTFPELLASADAFISSAVQEGFGYLFIDAVRQRLPLLARELPILEGIRPLFTGYPARFYRGITVALEEADATELGVLYRDSLEKLRGLLPAARIESLRYEVETLLRAKEIDFSYLSVDMQRRILEHADEPSFLEELRQRNPGIAGAGEELFAAEPPEKGEEIERLYGPETYAGGMEEILDDLRRGGRSEPAEPRERPEEEGSIHERLLSRFTGLEYLRLLYFQ